MKQCGAIQHHPLEGTIYAGCIVTKLGLAAFEVELPDSNMLVIVKTPWHTHTIQVVNLGDNRRHIVTYAVAGKPHISPACPFIAEIYGI